MNRRELLTAAAYAPIAAAVARVPSGPLTQDELRVLAMCATPTERLNPETYNRDRIAHEGTPIEATVLDLEARGFVQRKRNDNPNYYCRWVATASDAGHAELRKLGIDVQGDLS